jgi:hypothetical protein
MEMFSPSRGRYLRLEAIIDTGANICAIAEYIAEKFGLPISGETVHLWQVRDPLVLRRTQLDIRYNNRQYSIEAVVVDIPENLRRAALPGEKCTRPFSAHPLNSQIVLGLNFINLLSEEDRRGIGLA